MTSDQCQVCNKAKFRYSCPKCSITYCCVACYKAPQHIKCSEEFYKDCIRDELTGTEPNSNEDVRKIYNILKRIRESDAGLQPEENFDNEFDEPLDSDDEIAANNVVDDSDDDGEENIAQRLAGIDINDADEVWKRLTSAERLDFQQMIDTGDINKVMPDYKPWWQKRTNSKIVELSAHHSKEVDVIPEIADNIAKFSDICKKIPSPCLHYNLWNILASYACTVRFFCGEQLTNPWEATEHLVKLSSTLKYNTNFEDVEDALVSVEMEELSTADRNQLQQDAKLLMASRHYKLAALSDILKLLKCTRQHVKRAKKEDVEFQKLFAMCSGNVEINNKKMFELTKKIEFMLAYVKRESEEELK